MTSSLVPPQLGGLPPALEWTFNLGDDALVMSTKWCGRGGHMLGGLVAIGLASVSGLAATPSALPEGWIYIEREGIDTTPGAYHDTVSGVFVRSEAVALANVVAPWVETKQRRPEALLQTAELAGFEYREVLAPERKPGCQELTVSLVPTAHPDTSWNFGAEVCGPAQQKRVRALILALPGLLHGWPGPNEFNRSGTLRLSQIRSLALGAAWTVVRRSMGPPEGADVVDGGGFAVSYTFETRQVTLSFAQDQRLVKADGLPSASKDAK